MMNTTGNRTVTSTLNDASPPARTRPGAARVAAIACLGAAAVGSLAMPCAAQRGDFFADGYLVETPDNAVYVALGIGINAAAFHFLNTPLSLPPSAGFWPLFGWIEVRDGVFDHVGFFGNIHHEVAPHGEAPNSIQYVFDSAFNSRPPAPRNSWWLRRVVIQVHEGHKDIYAGMEWARLGLNSAHQIEEYGIVIVAEHTGLPGPRAWSFLGLWPEPAPPDIPDPAGVCVIDIDNVTRSFTARLVLPRVSQQNIVSVALYRGSPQQSGSQIFDLDNGATFQGDATLGVTLTNGGSLAGSAFNALASGDAHIRVLVNGLPWTEARGQVMVVDNSNDSCNDATPVGEGTHPFDTTEAHATGIGPCGFVGSNDVWFLYTPSESGLAVASTCNLADHDTTLMARSECSGAAIACNDDSCGLSSRIEFPVVAGQPVLIAVGGFNGSTGTGSVDISISAGNDDCANATPIGVGTFPYNLAGATNDSPIPWCGSATDAGDRWFRYTSFGAGIVTVSNCGLTTGDSVLTVLDACGGNLIACNNDSCAQQSVVTFEVTDNPLDYLLRISDSSGFEHDGSITVDFMPGIPCADNDCCSMATPVGVPGTTPYDLAGATNDWAGTCGATATAEDRWFVFTAPNNGTMVVSTCGLQTNDTVLSALDECAGSQIICIDDSCAFQAEIQFSVVSGEDYYIRIADYAGGVHAGSFSVSMLAPCTLTPPGAGTPEGEPCGSDTNGGCNSPSPIFGTIACGEVVSGSAWTSGGTRDTDWYDLALPGPAQVTISAQARFPVTIFIIDTNCPPAVLAQGVADRCQVATVTALIGGSCRVVVANQAFDGNTCGAENDYWLSVDSCIPVGGPPNDTCATALGISGSGQHNFDNTLAGQDGNPDPLCLAFGTDQIASDLWWIWSGNCDGNVVISLCAQTGIDSKIAVYDNGTNPVPICPSGAALGCVDDFCALQTELSFVSQTGRYYLFRVGSFPGSAGGPGGFTVTSCAPSCPCDFNRDGQRNSQDFFDFLACFFAPGSCQPGAADFNADGLENSQDFFDFLVCFFSGC